MSVRIQYDHCMPTVKAVKVSKVSIASKVKACPVEQAIHVIGGKWKLLVLRSLLLNGPQGYNRLLASVTGISAKELTRNLGELTACGLVTRRPGASARTAAYELTRLGRGLMPTFKSLLKWGQRLLKGAPTNIPVR
jgi:DNA-binding HxlR family transcriptional regulator